MLLGDPFVQVLALKLGKLASEQFGIALNIPPMAQNFGGSEGNHRPHLTEMAVLRMGGGEFAASADGTAQLSKPATRPIGNSAERPYKKPRCGRGLRLTAHSVCRTCAGTAPGPR